MGLAEGKFQTQGTRTTKAMRTDSHQHSRRSALSEVKPLLRVPWRQYLEDRLDNTRDKLPTALLSRAARLSVERMTYAYLANNHKGVRPSNAESLRGAGITYPRSDNK